MVIKLVSFGQVFRAAVATQQSPESDAAMIHPLAAAISDNSMVLNFILEVWTHLKICGKLFLLPLDRFLNWTSLLVCSLRSISHFYFATSLFGPC